jgi:Domain of unknown function (DUF4129)
MNCQLWIRRCSKDRLSYRTAPARSGRPPVPPPQVAPLLAARAADVPGWGKPNAAMAGNRLSGVPMPVIDKPTGRVVALIALLIVVAASLRGYLPGREHAPREEPTGDTTSVVSIAVLLSVSLAIFAVALITRLRDPRTAASSAGGMSETMGGGGGRPSWRVLLIALAVLVAWVLVVWLLARLAAAPPGSGQLPSAPESSTPTPANGTAPPPPREPPDSGGDVLGYLGVATAALLLMLTGAIVVASRRRRRVAIAPIADDRYEPSAPSAHSESLVRAAELGLAEIADLNRDPREAIIACYAAMERELANFPGAVPQDFDTPTEVLVRAVEHHALHADNAAQLVNLFEEARFSPHVMNEGHREVAEHVLRLVLAELRSVV